MTHCNICLRQLDKPDDPTSRDCGGDCLLCMAIVAEDPDCIRSMMTLVQEGVSMSKHAREEVARLYNGLEDETGGPSPS